MNVLLVQVDAIRIVTTPMDTLCVVATLDTNCILTIELVMVRKTCINSNLYTCIVTIFVWLFYASHHTDLDECALGISECNQICTNSIGSYVCSCHPGYRVSIDNKICLGMMIYLLNQFVSTEMHTNGLHKCCYYCFFQHM